MKKVLCFFLSIIILFSSVVSVSALELTRGDCGENGDNVQWSLDISGVITFTGTGKMKYQFGSTFPLAKHMVKVAVIERGITDIGWYAFYNFSHLEKVIIKDTVTEIHSGTFQGCRSLSEVVIPSSVTKIWSSAFDGCDKSKLVICCEDASYAKDFAIKNKINYKIVTLNSDGTINEIVGGRNFGDVEAASEKVEFNGHYYQVVDKSLSWLDAKAECERKGGHLVTITSATENDFVTNLISDTTKKSYWIGLIEEASTGTLSWVTDEPVDYTNWDDGEPNDMGAKEIYTHILTDRLSGVTLGKWNDTLLEGLNFEDQGYICEWDTLNELKGDFSVLSYSTLKEVTEATVAFDESHLEITSTDYYNVDIEDCSLKKTTTTFGAIPLDTFSHISAVHCNGYDAIVEADNVKFPISGKTSDDDKEIVIRVYTDLPDYKEFQILQNGAVLKTSESGFFRITAKTIPAGSSLDVRVVGSDGTKHKKLHTNIETIEAETSFSIEKSGVKITIPDDILVIGGTEIELDLEKLPIFVMRSEDTIRIGIGNSNSFENDEVSDNALWGGWKNIVNKMGEETAENIVKFCRNQELYDFAKEKKPINGFSSGMSSEGSIFAAAFAEFKRVDGEWIAIGAGGYLVAELRIGNEWQTFVYGVPVVLKLEGAVGANIDLSFGYDLDAGKCYVNSDIEVILPEVKGSAGIGIVKLFDGSIYAKLTNTLKVSFTNKYNSCTLNGEVGLSGKFLCFSGEKKLKEFLNWQYYYESRENSSIFSANAQNYLSTAPLYDSESYTIDSRDHLENQSEWYGLNYSISGEKLLQESVYEAANPKIVTTSNGTTMMVWTADIPERSTGNHVAVVYSIYDSDLGWSEPKIICDDGTADSYPDVIAYEDTIYVTWVNVNKKFDENVTVEEMAEACEISVASYNSETDSFTKIADLTNDAYFNYLPSLAVDAENVYVCYAENTGNNPFIQEGENSLYIATINENGSFTTEKIPTSTNAKPITELDIGFLEGNLNLVYLMDMDSNVNTSEDIEMFIYDNDNDNNKQPVQITDNDMLEQSVQFATINGKDSVSYYCNNNIYYFNDISTINSVADSGNSILSPEYKFVNDENGTTLITKAVSLEDDATNLFAFVFTDNGWLNPVKVTDSDVDIKSFDAYKSADNGIAVVYSKFHIYEKELVEIEPGEFEGTYKETVDLYSTSFERYSDISINNVTVYDNTMNKDGNVLVNINVTNNGLTTVDSFNLCVKSNDEDVYQTSLENLQLLPGETRDIEVFVSLGEINSLNTYNFKIENTENCDVDLTNNEKSIEIGFVDFELSFDRTVSDGKTSSVATIKNNSCVASDLEIIFRRDSYDGEIVQRIKLPTIDSYEEVKYYIMPDFISNNFNCGDAVCVEVVSVKEEKDTGNNYQFFTVSQPEIDTFDYEVLTNNCIEITKYNGDNSIVIIPETFDDYTVTSISSNIISSNITSITLPSTIETVDVEAFNSATSLTEIIVADGNINYKDMDGILYSADGTTIIRCPIAYEKDVVLESGLLTVSDYAFESCTRLNSITFSDSVTEIGEYAFSNCDNLTEVNLPDTVTSIGNGAFYWCRRLTSIVIPEGVTSIGERTFYNCRSLTSIVIPEGVTSIGESAFSDCISLTSIVIPEGVTSIGKRVFYYCRNLTSIVIPEDVTSIGEQAFLFCTSLTSITIPEGVTSIGVNAFAGCLALTKIKIPESVTTIDSTVFTNSPNTAIYCNNNSIAHNFAINNNMPFIANDDNTAVDFEKGIICTEYLNAEISDIMALSQGFTYSVNTGVSGTGALVDVMKAGVLHSQYTLVVNGDTNGDSVCNVLDVFDAERASNGNIALEGVYAMAADINSDDIIDITDYQAIVNKALTS